MRPQRDARGHKIQSFLCPSTPWTGLTSYAACHHDVEAPIAADNHGVFFLDSQFRTMTSAMARRLQSLSANPGRRTSLGWAVGTMVRSGTQVADGH